VAEHEGDGALDRYWAFLKEAYRQKYSEVAADHMVYPRNSEQLADYSGFGIINDDRDETMAIWLKIENGRIVQTAFKADDCIACTACGSAVTELARGKTVEEAKAITAKDVIESLQGLPEEDHPCAQLAVDTVKTAVNDYLGV
jgi:nitrogen fixation protein NifU and related proteins